MSNAAQARRSSPDVLDRRDAKRLQLGVPGLDEILAGGLPAGHLYVIEGTPGAGKTTIALQFVLSGRRAGHKVLYISLSESRAELFAVAASHGWDLDGIPVHELAPQEDTLRPEQQYSVFNPEDVELDALTDMISRKVEEVQPSLVVIDSLSELRLLARDNFRYRRQMLALKNFFEERKCTVLLLDTYTENRGEPQLHSIVHGIISLQMRDREYGIERRRIRVQKIRGSRFREGFHDYRITTGGVVVHPRLVASEHRKVHEQNVLSSGIEEFDQMLGGGVTRGTSTLLIGPAGAGKSTLAAKFAHSALQRGEGAAVYIFDETEQTFLERSASLSMDFRPFLENGKLHLRQLDPAEMPPGELIDDIRARVSQGHASVVMIDSLNGFSNAMPGENYLQLQMHELLTYLSMQGVSTLLVLAQQGVFGPMHSAFDMSYLADAIVLLRYFESRGAVRKAVSVMKKRSGFHEVTIRELLLKPGSIMVGEPLEDFHGVLTGVPEYTGKSKPLLRLNHGKKK